MRVLATGVSAIRFLAALGVWSLLLLSLAQGQVSQWRENGEQGTSHIIDGTQDSYDLLQSELVAEGDFAFHLANPEFQTSWFAIDQDISVEADTQLFFRSRLRAATEDQVAQVQLSTDGGVRWPTTVYAQPGLGAAGEGGFALRDVPLGDYAGQDVRLRFQLAFSAGSAYIETNVRNGWIIDDIQIGAEFQKLQFSVGDPSPIEQAYLEFTNRARADAMREAERLANETAPAVLGAYNFFDVDVGHIVAQYQNYVDRGCLDPFAQPLSFNETLMNLSALHSQDMFENEFQEHVSSANPPAPLQPGDTLADRLSRVGYVGTAGENIFSFAESVEHGHAGFAVDWGNSSAPGNTCYDPALEGQGMQNPAGHRINLHRGFFKEIGIGVVEGNNGAVGPQVITQNLGDPGDVTYITGVVYEDLNGNAFYDVGEGREGVRVDAEGSAYFAVSSASGAYSIPVEEDGKYAVTFHGGGFSTFETNAQVAGGWNVKIDYLVQPLAWSCDFDGDQQCSSSDLTLLFAVGDLTLGVDVVGATAMFDLDVNQRIDAADLQHWLTQAAEQAGWASPFLPGDTELDGDVDFADFLSLSSSFGLPGAWSQGNFDGSATVDFADFLQLSGNFGRTLTSASQSVPEPLGTWWPIAGIVVMLTMFRARRR